MKFITENSQILKCKNYINLSYCFFPRSKFVLINFRSIRHRESAPSWSLKDSILSNDSIEAIFSKSGLIREFWEDTAPLFRSRTYLFHKPARKLMKKNGDEAEEKNIHNTENLRREFPFKRQFRGKFDTTCWLSSRKEKYKHARYFIRNYYFEERALTRKTVYHPSPDYPRPVFPTCFMAHPYSYRAVFTK